MEVQQFRGKGCSGLGWQGERSPICRLVRSESAQHAARFQFFEGKNCLTCCLDFTASDIRRAQGIVGRVYDGREERWQIAVSNIGLHFNPQFFLLNQHSQAVMSVHGSQGEYDYSLDREVLATAGSSCGTRLWITGPNAVETLASIFHPSRVVFGFTNHSGMLVEEGFALGVLLFDQIFEPLIPWSGAS